MMDSKEKPQTEKRSIGLGVNVSPTEEKIIIEKANQLGMNKSEYVRFLILNAKVEVSM